MLIDIIAGARPNFMKIAPIIEAIEERKIAGSPLDYRLVHTGQHYDKNMSGAFFEQLGIPEPDINFNVGGSSQAEQTGRIMVAYEKLLREKKTELCLVVGDVNSTMACAITARKMLVNVAHVEAGIRSGDMTMPEEVNRIVTDSLTNYFFTTSETANRNLAGMGVQKENIFFVGNTMIDTLLKHRNRFVRPACWEELKLKEREYLVVTLHRPANVDQDDTLRNLIYTIVQNSRGRALVFPVHPRTALTMKTGHICNPNLYTVEPMPYLEFNYLVSRAYAVITDSGGITEETTVLGIPCLTLRNNTERPETVTMGTNELVGTDLKKIPPVLDKLFDGRWKSHGIPPLWDGLSGKRIVKVLESLCVSG